MMHGQKNIKFPVICLNHQVYYPSYLPVKLILLLYEHHYSTTDFTHAIQIATTAHIYGHCFNYLITFCDLETFW